MTEEEKEAIETLQYLCSDDCINKDIIKTIVKLIEKLQKENEELHKGIEQQGNAREIEEEYIEKNFISKDKIREAKQYLEYYLIGNLKYENCQNEFKKILKLLEEE